MSGRGRPRAGAAGGFVLLALVGEWVAHAATWYLTGGATPGQAFSGVAHTYLEPVGLVLVALAGLASWSVWRGLRRLVAMARSFESAVGQAWRRPPRPDMYPSVPGVVELDDDWVRPGHLWAALLTVQLVVYLVQENVEAHAAGFGIVGLHVLTAHHGSALAVHAAVALLASMVAVEVCDRWVERSRAVAVAARAYHAVVWRRGAGGMATAPRRTAVDRLLDRVGRSILSRPPPLLASI
ncbi:MAG TPA: hypothetical protein VMT43_09135 [Acidimicrobiales bacterium]|nr:hypothetical protein [Acidimicrobiales bacterium]